MRTITAAEIEQRGLQAVDEQLCKGPVHVLAGDQPAYVIMTEAHYAELVDAWSAPSTTRQAYRAARRAHHV